MSNKKYRINEMLDRLPIKQHKIAMRVLPLELGVSVATFNNYRAITLDDTQDIPHTSVVKLEQFFSLDKGELQNFTTDIVPINKRPDESESDVATEFSLSK